MMKSQLERLNKHEVQSLHINRRLLKAIAEEVVENKENPQQHQQQQHQQHQQRQHENELQQEADVEEAHFDPSTTPLLTTSALLGLLCSAMDSSSSTLQEVWINDDMIQYSKSSDNDEDDDDNNDGISADSKEKQEYAGQCLLHTLTTLPCLRRLRFFLSATMTKAQSEFFMQLVAPTIRACTLLQSLHFCMSNNSRPAPAAAAAQQQEDEDDLPGFSFHHASNRIVPSIISVGFCSTPIALHTLASVGLENHPSLLEFGLQDVVIMGNHKPPTTVAAAVSSPLDPILMALASLPQLETVDISLSKPLFQPPPSRYGLHRGQPLQQRPKPVVASTSRPCYFSGRALGTFFQKARLLQDCTLWDVGLKDEHLCHLLPALQFHPRLQFLSLRGSPGMTRSGWWKFYEMLLNGNYTLRSLFHDGGFGDDVEQAMDQVLYWNLLGRGRLFSSSSSCSLSHSVSCLSLSSLSSKSSSSTSYREVDDWIDMLENVNDDVTSLFYFLRQGNAILMPPSSSSSSSS